MRVPSMKQLLRNINWQVNRPFVHESLGATHVDLGSGNNPRNPFQAQVLKGSDFNSDFEKDGIEFIKIDLTKKLPFSNNEIDSFSAFDVLEHIPRWERSIDGINFPFVDLMAEIFRCLKPGGLFLAVTPSFPSAAAFQDPTHVNIISKNTLIYFCGSEAWAKLLGYGYNGSFEIVANTWLRGYGFMNEEVLVGSNGLPKSFTDSVTLSKRIIGLAIAPKPTHLLWVLRKPNLPESAV